MIKVEGLHKRLGDFQLKNISFSVKKGEYFVLLGRSGMGKTVILELISGLLTPDQGRIFMDEKEITHSKIQHRNIGLVYQDQNLFPHMSVEENIQYPLKVKRIKKSLRKQKVIELAETLEIQHLLKRNIKTLSIGEAQRVAIARSLALEPSFLLLDEPLASLDLQAKQKIRKYLRQINSNGITIIHITHDYQEAMALAHRVAILENNTITQIGTCEQIFQHPKSEFVARFIGIKNFYKGYLKEDYNNVKQFICNDIVFHVITEHTDKEGFLIIRSEDITLTNAVESSSALNNFKGKIVDIEKATLGIEVTIDIGLPVCSLISKKSLEKMNLSLGKEIFVNFKASAVQFLMR